MTFVIIVLILLIFLYYENNKIDISNYKITSNKIKNEDLKILHLSDLHCKSFCKNQKYLIKKIKNINPDIIVFTGDLISRRVDKEKYINSYLLLEELSKTFPIYFTTGNHEYKSKALKEVQEKLTSFGVHVLINNYEKFTIKNTEIFIFGFDDTSNFNEALIKHLILYII
ncbi:MAG: metallophosphoesterase [Clostridium sp.]